MNESSFAPYLLMLNVLFTARMDRVANPQFVAFVLETRSPWLTAVFTSLRRRHALPFEPENVAGAIIGCMPIAMALELLEDAPLSRDRLKQVPHPGPMHLMWLQAQGMVMGTFGEPSGPAISSPGGQA